MANGYAHEGLSLSPDGSRLARYTLGSDARYALQTWDVRQQKQLGTPLPTNSTFARPDLLVEFSPDGRRIAYRPAAESARVDFYDAATGRLVTPGKAPLTLNYTSLLRWSPDGKQVLLAPALVAGFRNFAPETFFTVDAATGETLATVNQAAGEQLVSSPVWSPGSDLLVAAVWHGPRRGNGPGAEAPVRLVVWDSRTGERLGVLGGGMNSAPWDMAWSPDGKSLAVAGHDRAVYLWDVGGLTRTTDRAAFAARGVTHRLEGHAGDPGPEPVGSVTDPYPTGYAARPGSAAGAVRAVAWRPDGRLVASGSRGTQRADGKARPFGRVHLWEPVTGRTRAVLDATALALDWSADGGRLAALGPADGDRALRVTVWEVRDGDELTVA
jgi:WD40 repeat protein